MILIRIPGDIVHHVCTLSPGMHISITQVCSLIHLLLVMPATNAVSERSASVSPTAKSDIMSSTIASSPQTVTQHMYGG